MTAFDFSPAAARRSLADLVAPELLDDEAAILDRYATVVWNHLTEPGDGVAGYLVATLGPTRALRGVLDGSPAPALGGIAADELRPALRRWKPRLSSSDVDRALDLARAARVGLLTPGDIGWPGAFADLGQNAPLCLWVRGSASRLAGTPAAAVVGARAATSYGEHVTMDMCADLATSGVVIVSGAAYGIDGAAHRSALAVGGSTIALLAGGADRPYPAGHGQLIDRIARAGVVASEVPCGSTPTKWRFLARNRLIAALALATIVVEAGWLSGSLNTAGHAATLGRPLGAVPGPVTSGASAGCHRLLREYGATCVTSADDVRQLLALGAPDAAQVIDDRPRTDDVSRVRDALSTRSRRDAHDVARRSGMSVDEVESHLGMLLLTGSVDRDVQGWRLTSVGAH